MRKKRGVHLFRARKRAGESPQNLRKDDARVAARPPERTERSCGGNLRHRVALAFLDLLDRALHGHEHVCARIAVRHGEDVERIDQRLVLVKQRRPRQEHFPKQGAANGRVRQF